MRIINREDAPPLIEGHRAVFLMGRNYPTAEKAATALRMLLKQDGIKPKEVGAILDTPGAICPYSAWALIPKERT